MKILFVTPAMAFPNGGFRTIHEVAARLTAFGHEVALYSLAKDRHLCRWYEFPAHLPLKFQDVYDPKGFDILVICSPHSIDLADRVDAPPRVVIYCQGMEHLLRNTSQWQEACGRFYASRHPLVTISRWGIEHIKKSKPALSPIYYLGNGVNLDHFPVEPFPKDGQTVLVEGWESPNPAKDPEQIGPNVAMRLKAEGYRILAYSSRPLQSFPQVPDEYYRCPSLDGMNYIYKQAAILLKATKYDARACAPMEAMTKGTPTARALLFGDDDLTPENSLVTTYSADALYHVAKKLLTNTPLRQKLAHNCLAYVQKYTWDYWMPQYHAAFTGEGEAERVHQKTVIVSVVYAEPEWENTRSCIEACGAPVIYVEREPRGVGSLTAAANRGIQAALERYPAARNIWLVTNVTFPATTLSGLEAALEKNPLYGMIHPVFDSGHLFARRIPLFSGLHSVPFVELTAPILRRSLLDKIGLFDATMPYWGQDLDYGVRARAHGFLVGVDQETEVSHVYLHLLARHGREVTKKRLSLRSASDRATQARLQEKYGPNWASITGRHHRPGQAFETVLSSPSVNQT